MPDESDSEVGKIPNSADFPETPDTSALEERLKNVRSSSGASHGSSESSAESLAKARLNERKDARGLGAGLQIAYSIIGFPVVGFGIGAVLDHELGTPYWKGFVGLAGCVLGIVSALILIKEANARQ
jgi:F0F1-type ATP synthase assembly protein I